MLGCPPASLPMAIPTPSRPPSEAGVASWYGAAFKNKLMASMIPFNPESMVAAHRTLELGTVIRVHNIRNGASVLVQIMDRGPYVKGRVLDLSHAAARLLGFESDGLADIEFDVVHTATQVRALSPNSGWGKPRRQQG